MSGVGGVCVLCPVYGQQHIHPPRTHLADGPRGATELAEGAEGGFLPAHYGEGRGGGGSRKGLAYKAGHEPVGSCWVCLYVRWWLRGWKAL